MQEAIRNMAKIIHSLTILFLKGLSKLPFRIIYLLSDFLYVVVYYLAGYRKKVVYSNLRNSFPEKSASEIDAIAKKYYRHFCDLIMESVKLPAMTEKELNERLTLRGIEKTYTYADKGQSIVLIGMHYNNWEWSSTLQRFARHQLLIVFNPLRNNPEMERYLLDARERFGSKTVAMNQTPRMLARYGREGRPTCLFLAADQTPPRQSHFWTTFLNQETAFFSGPERIAIKTRQPVFLTHTVKTGRGKYLVKLIELFPEPEKVDPDTILLTYVDRLEKIIREQPEFWLWSHRRWKHKRPEQIALVPRAGAEHPVL